MNNGKRAKAASETAEAKATPQIGGAGPNLLTKGSDLTGWDYRQCQGQIIGMDMGPYTRDELDYVGAILYLYNYNEGVRELAAKHGFSRMSTDPKVINRYRVMAGFDSPKFDVSFDNTYKYKLCGIERETNVIRLAGRMFSSLDEIQDFYR
ncbi:hypothetical protein BASA81_008571 [Batrachochytrium salamandrivorans]|nr:hypothetical protein BASA81_008571 [Batrachochytrium salamandrivorans]